MSDGQTFKVGDKVTVTNEGPSVSPGRTGVITEAYGPDHFSKGHMYPYILTFDEPMSGYTWIPVKAREIRLTNSEAESDS